MNRTTKRIGALGTVTVAVMGAGLAYAAWTADGSGSGYVQAKTAQAVATATTTTTGTLYPGGTADLLVNVTNPNDYQVTVTAISGNGAITSGDATCDASNGVSFTDVSGLSQVVDAHSTGTLITLTGKVSMSNASVTACSGKTFTVPVSIAAASS